jgi:hypothetical protein
MITMKINSILKCSLTIILLIPMLTQCISASSCDDWQHTNIFFCSYGYTDDFRINNQSVLTTCFKKNVYVDISYNGWLLNPRFIVWNNSGLIEDFEFYHFNLFVTNFTGIIIHRIGLLIGNFRYLFGYCTVLKIHTPEYG